MKVVKAAAVQLSPVLYSREGHSPEKVVRKILELGQQGVQIRHVRGDRGALYYPYFSFVQSPFQNMSDLSSGSCSTRR